MTVTFYLKEDNEIEEDSVSITIVRKNKSRSQSVNAKKLDDLTTTEQQTIKSLISIIEKYRGEGKELTYGL